MKNNSLNWSYYLLMAFVISLCLNYPTRALIVAYCIFITVHVLMAFRSPILDSDPSVDDEDQEKGFDEDDNCLCCGRHDDSEETADFTATYHLSSSSDTKPRLGMDMGSKIGSKSLFGAYYSEDGGKSWKKYEGSTI